MSVDVRKRLQVVSLGNVRIARAYLVHMGMKPKTDVVIGLGRNE
jgi:hypothetical protein